MKFKFGTLLFFAVTFTTIKNSLAWDGVDQNRNSPIEIGPGNLVREGLVIDFYDSSELHTGRVITMNEIGNGTELVVADFNENNEERTFIMRE